MRERRVRNQPGRKNLSTNKLIEQLMESIHEKFDNVEERLEDCADELVKKSDHMENKITVLVVIQTNPFFIPIIQTKLLS